MSVHLPGQRQKDLIGGVLYYDYRTNDARLVLENAIDASNRGAQVISYCGAESLQYSGRRVSGLEARDMLTGEHFSIRARSIVCAAGPWTDAVRELGKRTDPWLRPTKGVHVVVSKERLPVDTAMVMRHPVDRRVLFVLPYHERTVIGTTDTDFRMQPGDVRTTRADVDYLLTATNHYFPAINLKEHDVTSNWAGIRPLVRQKDASNPSAVSREHRIDVRSDRVITLAGGKLTTYRLIAAEVLDRAATTIGEAGGTIPRRCETHRTPLPGARGIHSDAQLIALANELSAACNDDHVGSHLAHAYGVRGRDVIASASRRSLERLDPELPFTPAEIVYGARYEMPLSLVDTMVRRTHIFYRATDQGRNIMERIAELMGSELNWTNSERIRQLDNYANHIAQENRWKNEPPTDELNAS